LPSPAPARSNFLPATGTLKHLSAPRQSANVRVDTGVRQGDAVSVFYDPMISKLIVWGETRADALRHMESALAGYQVAGLPNNLAFLGRTVAHPGFAAGGVDTSFLGVHLPECLPVRAHAPPSAVALAALAVMTRQAGSGARGGADATSPWGATDGSRPGVPTSAAVALPFTDPDGAEPAAAAAPAAAHGHGKGGKGGKHAAAAVDHHAHVRATVLPLPPALPTAAGAAKLPPGSRAFKLAVGGATIDVAGTVTDITASVPLRSAVPGFEAATTGKTVPGVTAYAVSAALGGSERVNATVVTVAEPDGLDVYIYPSSALPGTNPATDAGRTWRLSLPLPKFGKAGAGGGSGAIKTPMPGKVIKVMAKPGDAVAEGAPLMIMEAMKMEHVIKAPSAGTVDAVHYKEGEFVEDGRELLTFKA
jgi:biotin carboxyl carrier protein